MCVHACLLSAGLPLTDEADLLPWAGRLFEELSQNLGRNWEPFATFLGLSREDIVAIDCEQKTNQLKGLECLQRWRKQQMPEPFVEHIIFALDKLKLNNCIIKCREYCKKYCRAEVGGGQNPVEQHRLQQGQRQPVRMSKEYNLLVSILTWILSSLHSVSAALQYLM